MRRRLDPGLLARMMVDQFDLQAVALAPARVHAAEHLGPVLALGSAGAGVDLDIGVVGVRLARRAARRPCRARRARRARRVPRSRLRPSRYRPRPRPSRTGSTLSSSSASIARVAAIASSSRRRSRMTSCAARGSFQRLGSSTCSFSCSSRLSARSQSKKPPQQGERLLDLRDMGFGFGAHPLLSCDSRAT